jgi:hypothetical protein
MSKKQVNKDHYHFSRYVSKTRWASMWHQLDEVLRADPERVLEIGPGPGVLKAVAGLFGVKVETLDIDPELSPDHLASAEHMPFDANCFDVVCAFQVLEHVPYEQSLAIFAEMSRVTKRYIILSLPDSMPAAFYSLHVPRSGQVSFLMPRPWLGGKDHVFDGEHYWELNKLGHSLEKVKADLKAAGDVALERTYQVKEFSYHRFLVFRKLMLGTLDDD